MRVLVSGASGMIGSALATALRERGHEVVRLGRSARAPEDVRWDPATWSIEHEKLKGIDAAVHLAGENLSRRWSENRKKAILGSREKGTRLLAETLASLEPRPRVLVSASAIGFYGSRGDEVLTEESSRGLGFLAGVCRAWEDATRPASAADIRVAILRFGIVLSKKGGALARLLPPFRLGLGGPIAGGEQYMSWIAIDDVVGLIERALEDEGMSGPTNAVAPEAVTNAEFTKTLANVLGRPAFMPLPGLALKVAFGEMADEVLLASQRVEPKRALAAGYRFRYPELEGALRHVLGKE